jgi:GT2 family glycosyltransferase/Flp pilus assembly protein TadD
MNSSISVRSQLSISEIKTIQADLEQARIHVQHGQWQQAIPCYEKVIKINPNSATTYHYWGDALLNLQQWEEAATMYRRAIAINPQFDWSYYNLGEALAHLNRWEEAIIVYQQALDLNANLPSIYQKLGNAFYQRAAADRKEMLASYRQAIAANPHKLEHYHQALELQPQDAELYLGLGNALITHNKLDEAIVAYQMALQLQPDYRLAQLQLDLLLKRQEIDHLNITNTIKESSSQASKLQQSKQLLDNLNQIALNNFLLTKAKLKFPQVENPAISIILILYNRAELTLSCLSSILGNTFKSIELVIVDNYSTDKTRQLLERIEGAKIIFNEENKHFLLACNQASKIATGEYLLFLNNDAQILGDSLNAALKTIKSNPDIGAVGGKIILPDGTLQEAGSIIWQEGSCLGYGRGDNPQAPQYMFKRTVDYCSGAFLLTSRQLFLDLGSFDEAYKPAYYEETDYCVKLNKAGKKIIYDPNVVILHYEFASSIQSDRAIALQTKNKQIFVDKHWDWLQFQYQPDLNKLVLVRSRDNRRRILFLDDRIPHPYLGSGYTRGHRILSKMLELGYFITFYPTDLSYQEEWQDIYSDIDNEIEIMTGFGLEGLGEFLQTRKGYYDLIFISRPHNMNHLNYLLSQNANLLQGVKVIYDAEALYSLREIVQKSLQGEELSASAKAKLITAELNLARKSDRIVAVSAVEQQRFIDRGYQNVSILGHSLKAQVTPNHFAQRQHILFVGSIYQLESPNADSIIWLSKEILPLIQAQFKEEIDLLIVGNNTVPELTKKIEQLNNNCLKILGRVDDLSNLYNQARFFVAPTRFAAGIPHKVHEAAAHGLPVITTSLIASQLEWQDGIDLLVADTSQEFAQQCIRLYQDEELWNTLRFNALKQVESQCCPENFTATLKQILD